MRLEEALKFYREGRSIRRRSWQQDKKAFELYGVPYVTRLDIEADDWEVVRKKVSWPEAWEALQKGEHIIAMRHDWQHQDGTFVEWLLFRELSGGFMLKYLWGNHWRNYGDMIPIKWLDRTDFEIVEDE